MTPKMADEAAYSDAQMDGFVDLLKNDLPNPQGKRHSTGCHLREDGIKTKAGNQAQAMGLLRGLAIELIRNTMPKNFQAAIDTFADSAQALESMLLQVQFL